MGRRKTSLRYWSPLRKIVRVIHSDLTWPYHKRALLECGHVMDNCSGRVNARCTECGSDAKAAAERAKGGKRAGSSEA